MPGQYGNETVSVLNLKVARVDSDKHLLMVEGGIPGSKNALVTVRHGVKGRERKKR
jgi:large subunit ribosomal protein L3